jgi:hypothetical protein
MGLLLVGLHHVMEEGVVVEMEEGLIRGLISVLLLLLHLLVVVEFMVSLDQTREREDWMVYPRMKIVIDRRLHLLSPLCRF